MRIAVLGRGELLYETALHLERSGHTIACVVTSPGAPEYSRQMEDFIRFAEDRRIPYATSSATAAYRHWLASLHCDVGVSINFPVILGDSIIQLMRLGILNAHGGDLPRYRGNACQAWAILNGENRVGLCVHKMVSERVDEGDIIARDHMDLSVHTRIGDVWEWMTDRTPHLMLDAVSRLESDPDFALERWNPQSTPGLRCYSRYPEDARIDWSLPAERVLRLIKASGRPYRGAFCFVEGFRMTIWDADPLESLEDFCAVPGQVLSWSSSHVDVACGEGMVRLTEFAVLGAGKSSIIRSTRQRLS